MSYDQTTTSDSLIIINYDETVLTRLLNDIYNQ